MTLPLRDPLRRAIPWLGLPVALAIALVPIEGVKAQQTLFKELPGNWFVYKEDKSCALYLDTPSGTMLRFSDRREENRLYFMAVNDAWKLLRPRIGETGTLSLYFPNLNRGYGTLVGIFENVDGRIGFTGNSLVPEDVMTAIASEKGMVIRAYFARDKTQFEIETVVTVGGALAAVTLADCTLHHFGR